MNSKGHLTISLVKSFLRIVAIVLSAVSGRISCLYIGFVGAEILGVIEELVDKR